MSVVPLSDWRGPRRLPKAGGLDENGLALRIADAIIAGEMAPGLALSEEALAQSYSVSRTPVREALRQLAATGLFVIEPRRGAFVAAPSEKALHDMFLVMAELEALCAGLAAAAMSTTAAAALDAAHRRSRDMVREGDRLAYATFNVEFHEAIYEGSGNGYLAELTRAAQLRLAPFRKAQFGSPHRLAASFAEHEAIVRSILRGDRNGASVAMRDHIGTVEKAYQALAPATLPTRKSSGSNR
jgi:DNA-binding GntR family transcriptional regulator